MILTYAKLLYYIATYKIARVIGKPLSLPINLTLSITNRCYSRCKTCNVWKLYKKNPKKYEKELKNLEWEKILKNIGTAPLWVTITGGETMLRKDLVKIIGFIIKYNRPQFINIATSGIYKKKTKEYLESILALASKSRIIVTVNISIDEIGDKYDDIRGISKGFRKVKETYFLLKSLKVRYPKFILGVNTVLSKYNYRRFKKIVTEILQDLDPDSFVSEIGSQRNAIYFNGDISISTEEYLKNLDFLIETKTQSKKAWITGYFRKKFYGLVKKQIMQEKEIMKCYAGYASCEISCTGEVWDCAVRAESMGNLRKNNYDFRGIWLSKRANSIRQKIKKDRCFCNTANPNYTNLLCNLKI